ncbi:MAG: ribonuclease HI family protein [Dehalococcoidia bacterium]|nr:ribonuclease HI family protein [Dehalococcoidia bacterium]
MKLVINTDGLSKNNPGPAAIGAVLKNTRGQTVATISEAIGKATNNEAEYRAVISALEKALALGAKQIELRSDSELVVNQLKGSYKVKSTALRTFYLQAASLLNRFEKVYIVSIPREQNTVADKLANAALRNK